MIEAVNDRRNHSVKVDTHRFNLRVKNRVNHITKKHQRQLDGTGHVADLETAADRVPDATDTPISAPGRPALRAKCCQK